MDQWFKKLTKKIGWQANQHQACWVLTRKQLRRAIDSGGF
jgi:hypothetical protein